MKLFYTYSSSYVRRVLSRNRRTQTPTPCINKRTIDTITDTRVTDQNVLLNQMANYKKRLQTSISLTFSSFNRVAFDYNPDIAYCIYANILICNIDTGCRYRNLKQPVRQ